MRKAKWNLSQKRLKSMCDNIYIRPLRREDALISYKWRNDPDIWVYTGRRPDRTITPEIELEWIERVLRDPSSRRFAICLKDGDIYIGNVQLTDIEKGMANFHIFIGAKEYWGKGIATEATRHLLKYAKDELKLKKLHLWVNPLNKAAVKVYLKCGFSAVDDSINMIMDLD